MNRLVFPEKTISGLTLFSPLDFFFHHPLTGQGLAQLLSFSGDPVHRAMHIIGIS
jgi:hypothetical protein